MIPWDKSDERCCLSLPIFRAPSIFIEINLKLKLFISMSRQRQQHHSSVGWLCACDYDFLKKLFFSLYKWVAVVNRMDWISLLFVAGWVFFPLVLIDSMSKRRAKWDFFRCEKRLRVRVCTSRKLLRPLILRECMRNGTEHTTSHIAKQLRLWFIFLYSHFKGGKPRATSTNLCCCSAALPHCCHSLCVWKSNQK